MIDLSSEIAQALKEYTTEVEKGIDEAKKKNAQNGAKLLRASSPKKTGKYAKGWKAKKVGKGYVIHNATRPGLAHLLEKGHAKRGGGRVGARVHIKPVEEQVIKDYESDVEKVIKG